MNATELLLTRRLQEGDPDEPLDDGPAGSLLQSLRVASNAGASLGGGEAVAGGERMSNSSGLLGQALLRGSIPGEEQRVLTSESGDGSGISLEMVAGCLDVLGLDTANVSMVAGGADVLGLVAIGNGSAADFRTLAQRYCNQAAGALEGEAASGGTALSTSSTGATFGVALVDQSGGGRRRILQASGEDLFGGVDATAMEWKTDGSGVRSPHPTE